MRDITIVPQDYIVTYTKTDTVMKKFDDGCEVYEVIENRKPLVRCKDCKYWHSNTEFCDIWSYPNVAQRTLSRDYCSRGERREDGEE